MQFMVYQKKTGEAGQRRGEQQLPRDEADPPKEENDQKKELRTQQGREEERRWLRDFSSELCDWSSQGFLFFSSLQKLILTYIKYFIKTSTNAIWFGGKET